jgi:CubicO group peptidase (beta-lactamase class C family)
LARGGVIEKAAKQPLSWLMQRYLVQPLELDGAYFGTPNSELQRVARLLEKPKNHLHQSHKLKN